MQGYLNKGKELLKILINNGFEGYFYGETVRNSIKGLDCDHVDIITSASVDELSRILVKYNFTPINKNSSYLNMDG